MHIGMGPSIESGTAKLRKLDMPLILTVLEPVIFAIDIFECSCLLADAEKIVFPVSKLQ